MDAIGHALSIAGSMTWEVTWALILGFTLSAVVQAVVRRSTVVELLGDDRPRTLTLSAGLGAASSSCSYAAVALARSLFRKGANFTAAMAFEIASTNLVIELGIIMALLMGWQFTAAEFVGGPVMIVVLAVLFRLFLRERLLSRAREQAEQGLSGSMEGHAAMDMSVQGEGSFARRLFSRDGFTSVAHIFVMEWAAILRDLVAGLLIAGAIAAWVPDDFWRTFFLEGHPLAAKLVGPLVGPLVAIATFVCSIGNVPLAVVLWKGGISFGGVIAFIYADLLILPILNIYRKYYGARMAAFLLVTFFAAMTVAGYVVEFSFGGLGLIPDQADATIPEEGITWNYTTWLNITFLLLAAALLARFWRTGGSSMLRMMGGSPDHADHEHGHARMQNGHHH
ncbi:permease [Streptomyces sp. NBC_00201]|uniref:permease n=1 Tax=unclassified Streptomyces TaxID=2593676 RepID=UPI002256B5C1|nr:MULTISPECIES: permease [unclassified Streptomyces]MCX5063575.1 permease [Streptomyces sp. NBC_00452]MCX5251733.1 permease [Streptomyces sp. NBC_00201]MCX5294344.1 permease [Streptomyces sp. NBC_00183]